MALDYTFRDRDALIRDLHASSYGRRRTWLVDAKNGDDTWNGLSWEAPLKTMTEALAADRLRSGDRVEFIGKVREQVVAPDGVFDVQIIGRGNRPRHADDHTESDNRRGSSAATWAAPASGAAATTALCRVIHQGWLFDNILWVPHTDYGALEFVRDAESGDDEKDGSHGSVIGCRFAGGKYAILSGKAGVFTEIVHNLLIKDNEFNDQTDSAIYGINGRRFKIIGNDFMGVDGAIEIAATEFKIMHNMVGKFTTTGINLAGGTGNNVVTKNFLTGDYSNTGGYTAGSNDYWVGNIAEDTAEAEVEADGTTNAVPAA